MCNLCRTLRDHDTTDKSDETCPKNTKESREQTKLKIEKQTAELKIQCPDGFAVKGTHLELKSMIPGFSYKVADYLSFPDCQCGRHGSQEFSDDSKPTVTLVARQADMPEEEVVCDLCYQIQYNRLAKGDEILGCFSF